MRPLMRWRRSGGNREQRGHFSPRVIDFDYVEEVITVEDPFAASSTISDVRPFDQVREVVEFQGDAASSVAPIEEVTLPDDPRIDLMLTRIEFLVEMVQSRAKFDETRELQVRKLYDELDDYKRDAHSARMIDLARGVMIVIDKLSVDGADSIPAEHIRDELVEHLASVGVTAMPGEVGTLGAPMEVVVRLLEAEETEEARLWQEGYVYEGRTIRPRQIERRAEQQ